MLQRHPCTPIRVIGAHSFTIIYSREGRRLMSRGRCPSKKTIEDAVDFAPPCSGALDQRLSCPLCLHKLNSRLYVTDLKNWVLFGTKR